ncbi:hypothetical protein C1O66_19385 [Paucibacter aquatile]|uniref:Lantibiotic dehydratase n=1 Tax=Kinneretia aquatilis TaxID=2070761 RepID=A0A2N8L199_9BURK|nr:lantibiotic dehydratase [Paucibacter aquatile]PND39483.1 hypothetical protein C1O66_19385 [Paucibacter aquatile]
MSDLVSAPDFVLLRHPLLPLEQFEAWCQSADREQYILAQYEQAWLDEALYVSSPSLHARLQELRAGVGELHEHPSERRKFLASLARFLSRAAYRCTPFGLFAQVQLGRVGATAPAEGETAPALRRGIHLDSGVEAWLIETALQDRSWRELLKWQISNTAFQSGAHLNYVDWVYQANRQRSYRAVEVSFDEALSLVLEAAQSPRPFVELCEALVRRLDVEAEEAGDYLHQLIDRRLLLPCLAPTASTACSLDLALAQSPDHPVLAPIREIQQQLHSLRHAADQRQSLVPQYQVLRARIEAQIGAEDLSRGVLQIDTLDARPAPVDAQQLQALLGRIQLLMRHTARPAGALQSYKRLFRERFEDREVNLAYALHPELGLAYPNRGPLVSPLLDGLRLGAPAEADSSGAPGGLLPLERLLLSRLFGQGAQGACIALTEADLQALPSPPALTLPEGGFAQLSVLPSPPGVAPKFELRGLGGRNGLELIARFCHLSPELSEAAAHYAREHRDEHPDCIYAEIIHHPQDRLLNILRRPSLATHELVYAGSSDKPREQQLWLSDLSIQLLGDRFVLRERRSGRRVIPRLSSAHNYHARQLGAYEFLAGLQDDDGPWLGFSWPAAVQHLPQLPRVELDGLVLARARWLLDAAQIAALNQAAVSDGLRAWWQAMGLPRYVTWDQHDNHLPVDLDNPASVGLLLDDIIKLPQATLHECLALNAASEHGCMAQHSQEWVLPLRRRPTPPLPAPAAESAAAAPPASPPSPVPWNPERCHLQGEGERHPALEEWAYLRLYTGAGYADRVLREWVAPRLRQARAEGLLSGWFFVRYQDSFEHLRLRVKGRDRAALIAVHAQLLAGLADAQRQGLLWRVQGDDYVPELARYGGRVGLSLSEQLFGIDSDDALCLLDLEAATEGQAESAPPRWLYALASLDSYARQLSPDPVQREALLEQLARQFLHEQAGAQGRSAALVAIGSRFREFRRELDALQRGLGSLGEWQQQLARSEHSRAPWLAALHAHLPSLPARQAEVVLHSLLHMHCNRLAPSEPRRHETLLYDFARRLERARQARKPAAPMGAA